MIERTLTPNTYKIDSIKFIEPIKLNITETVHLVWMKEVLDNTARVEFHFDAGSIHGELKIASFVNNLLFSGTPSKTSKEINHTLDYLGAFTQLEIGQEIASVSLFCLKDQLAEALSIVIDAIQNVSFPEDEINDMLREKKQQFLIGNERVSVLARKKFQQELFQSEKNYSRTTELEDYDHVSIEELKKFHKKNYLNGLRKIVVVGNISESSIETLIQKTSPWATKSEKTYASNFKNNIGHFHIEKKDSVQTAIRLGFPLFNKTHTDFIDFQILQTILGDYFGSRLMSNIREEKGYTYGIGCAAIETKNTGYFVIATEVGGEFVEKTLNEINYEIGRLKNEVIPDEELNLVKNYLMGQLLKSADGPNAMTDLYLSVQAHELNYDYYTKCITRINTITAAELMKVAKKHLNYEQATIVTAG